MICIYIFHKKLFFLKNLCVLWYVYIKLRTSKYMNIITFAFLRFFFSFSPNERS